MKGTVWSIGPCESNPTQKSPLALILFICKVTVAAGTISGLIFYANVIAVNQNILFPSGETNILTVFIAWLNLDLGIETCFIDGMDVYIWTWLQYMFPLYILLLVGIITLASYHSMTVFFFCFFFVFFLWKQVYATAKVTRR